MKKIVPAISLILAALMMMAMLTACADNAASAPAPAADPAVSAAPAAVSDSSEDVDPLVGSWRFPPSPFGDDFTCYVVLNADGSFYNATNLYSNGTTSGPYTQQVTTNETFRWVKLDERNLELHYSYLDDNGEFVTPLSYSAADDALYYAGAVYAVRDDSFVLVK